MQQSRIDFKKLRLQISLEYGVELDEIALAILGILMLEQKYQFATMNKRQEEMVTQIQQSKKTLQVDPSHPRWQAFWHGMGQWGLGLCLAIIAALTVYCFNLNKIRAEKQTIQKELAWYKDQYEAAQTIIKKAGPSTEKKSRQRNK